MTRDTIKEIAATVARAVTAAYNRTGQLPEEAELAEAIEFEMDRALLVTRAEGSCDGAV